MFDKTIASQIVIEASAMAVWRILTDFENYARWNPFIIRAKGEAIEGSKLEGDFRPVGAKPTTIKPRVVKAVPGQELRWVGQFGMPGLFDAEHIFLIEPLGTNAVRLIQQEKFSGLLVPFFKFDSSLAAFELMNQALKKRAETAAMVV